MSLRNFIAAAGVLAFAAVGTAQANEDAKFVLENTSNQQIDVIQVSPSNSDHWGPDFLGDSVLPSGGSFRVTPREPGCMFDVRVIYHNKRGEENRHVNLCQIERLSFANTNSYALNN